MVSGEDGLVLEIGALVRVRRRAAGLTQRALASRAGVSVGALRDLEQGRTRRPRLGLVTRLAEVLDLTAYAIEAVVDPPYADGILGPVGPGVPAAGLWLCVLGPLAAWRDGAPLALGPPRQRAVLGLLALNAGTSVHRDALIAALWGEHPPAAAVNEVQVCVSRLRTVLDPDRSPRDPRGVLVSAGTSYRLQLGRHELDWLAFRDLVHRAAAAASTGETEASLALYERATGLWQGVALADVDPLRGHPAVTEANRVWAAAVGDFAQAAVGSSLAERVLPDLWRWVQRDQLNEKAHALLMNALADTGEPAAALGVFADIGERLDAQLGLRPGPDLSAARLHILRQQVVPRQLPNTVGSFAGWDDERQALTHAARTWHSLGYAYHHLGRHTEAARCYNDALILYEQLDLQPERAETLDRLGDTQAALGDHAAARSSWRQAADILERTGLPGVQEIRDKMRSRATIHGGRPS